ncbi:MAG: tetratricopeptide repeat protein [Prevotellaceae bacterium]|jgi:tetratricopeptide (TPR) repeat protein|nr:tetratricopeptide repeat protein [Prevotellaceae bacterium]
MKFTQKIIVFVVLYALFVSCSTKKNTATTRAFHKFTGHYNTYFNGYESYKEGVKKAENTYPASFDELLPVFSFSYSETSNKVTSDMDRAITKSNKVINDHSITAKPQRPRGKKMDKEERAFYNKKEFNEKVSQSHMLVAKAQTYMQNYTGAASTLEYMDSQYAKDTVLYESRIWQAIVSTERNDLEDAENRLKAISRIRNYPKQHHQIYHSAWANLLIKQGKYGEAAERLQKALEFTKKRLVKTRYTFLLAQLYQKTGNKENALKYFTKVSKMNAPYNVRFAAQIQKANSFDPATQGSELKTLYTKMLKDKKNEEYADQIYYALGNLERLNSNYTLAVDCYNKSIEKNIDNTVQLGLSHKALGDLLFVMPDFVKSFYNYKEARTSLPQTHQYYEDVSAKIDMLEMLAPNLEIVEREDSLQNMAKMPQAERDKMIDNLIAEVKKQKADEQLAEQNRQYYVMQSDMERYGTRENAATQHSRGSNAKWYFYNMAQLNQGLTEFNMRWGKRKLEDNWRRRNKGMFEGNMFDEPQTETELAATDATADSIKTDEQGKQVQQKTSLAPDQREYYLQNLPLTTEAMLISDEKIMNALYLVATAYKNDLNDNKRATEAFEKLVKRFPNCEYIASSYYNLYSLYTENGETAKADIYKQLLATDYPDNILTLSIINPGYLQEMERREQQIEKYYEQALNLYKENKNTEALALINSMMTEYKDNKIIARLELLKALAANDENNLVAYKQALTEITTKYNGTETQKTASEMLKILQQDEVKIMAQTQETSPQTPADAENYLPSDKEQYIAALVDKSLDANLISFEIILFNADNYLNNNYETLTESFDDKYQLILVRTLPSKKDATDYYNDMLARSGFTAKLKDSDYLHFIISPDNLQKLKQSKNVAEYVQFFKSNY